ncbi:sugar ABC transporter substrate-binding protein [Arthrobacter sp. H5]|uniref:sugar ABC transporter substrate-binding protein n=1 Tax=Arthrobacter sp. H5 TaxID=1267973 RepID=UPI00048A2BD9|nr:sugar ABC transporter substrate-binding protein [Arthrobacter sp. H5]
MKKLRIPLAMAAAATLTLTACGGGDGGASTNAEGETLSVWIMQGTNPDAEAYFDEVKTKFTEETGATLDVQFIQWAEAHDRFVTSIAGGTTPDVAETGNTWTGEFADAGALAPLDEYVTAANLDGDLVEGLVESGTLDESLYGMPWYAGVRSVIYRTDIFEELGLEVPTTWDELVDVGLALKEAKPEMTPFAIPGDNGYAAYPFIWGNGANLATKEGDTWTSGLTSPEAREGLEFYTGLATEHGLSSAGATTWNAKDILDNFVQGNLPMAVMGSWEPPAILEQNPDLEGKIGAFPIPGPDGNISPSFLGGSHLSVFESSENKDLAWAFVEMMATGELADKWAEQTNYFPGQTSLLEDAVASDDPLVKPFATQFVEGGTSVPVTPQWGAVEAQKTLPAMIQSILSEQKTVDQATEDAAAEIEELLNGN